MWVLSPTAEERSALVQPGSQRMSVPLIPPFSWYSVYVAAVAVGGVRIPVEPKVINDGTCIVDSGTTTLTMNGAVYDAIVAALPANVPRGCGRVDPNYLASLPTITVVFGGDAAIDISPFYYFYPKNPGAPEDEVEMCFGLTRGDDSGDCILGDVAFQPYLVDFDREAKEVGFQPVNMEACVGHAAQ